MLRMLQNQINNEISQTAILTTFPSLELYILKEEKSKFWTFKF